GVCRNALNEAAKLCGGRTNYDVELEHFLSALLEVTDGDLPRILRHYDVDEARLSRDITRVLDRLKRGNARTPAMSPRILRLIEEAWTIASIDFDVPAIRSGHLLLALLATEDLARLARDSSAEFGKISVDDLRRRLADLTAGSEEDVLPARAPGAAEPTRPTLPGGKTPALDPYTIARR